MKEKFMQFVSDAYDQDTSMSFTFYGFGLSETQARESAKKFSDLIDGEIEKCISDNHKINWLNVRNDRFDASFFFDNGRESE